MKDAIIRILSSLIFLSILTCCDKDEDELTVKDIDGNTYKTVRIGTQTWMAENLKVIHDRNGNSVAAYCYDDDPEKCRLFGRLYQWDVSLKVCPEGWHIPSDEEWRQMEIELGLPVEESLLTGWRGTNQGTMLQAGGSSGFNALLAGYKDGTIFWTGEYFDIGYFGAFWSSSQIDSLRTMGYFVYVNSEKVMRSPYDKTSAFSVRCVKQE